MNVNADKKLMNELNCLKENNYNIYLNIKANISATFKMYWTMAAEREFLSGNFETFTCYGIAPNRWQVFRKYCELKKSSGRFYFCVSRDKSFAAGYHVNEQGVVLSQEQWYRQDTIEDILVTFEKDLIVCRPRERVLRTTVQFSA